MPCEHRDAIRRTTTILRHLDGDDEDGPVALLEHVDSGLRHLARRLEAELRERRKRRRDKH